MHKRVFHISIPKPGEGQINEDDARSDNSVVAVSDGAGGGGVYADLWSRYLLHNLPDSPILSFEELDKWIDGIWEPFYNSCEEKAKAEGGLLLQKFYDEGSFATLAAVWHKDNKCHWMAYGDSVVFHYNRSTDKLEHSFTRLADFDRPPYLINCKDEIDRDGFSCGTFDTDEYSIVFCASDALSHYILMMYELSHADIYDEELNEALAAGTKNSLFISAASYTKIRFDKKVIGKLLRHSRHRRKFTAFVRSLMSRKLLALDDFSYAGVIWKEID